jgi:hypothetical protein
MKRLGNTILCALAASTILCAACLADDVVISEGSLEFSKLDESTLAFRPGDRIAIEVEVQNEGDAAAPAAVEFWADDTYISGVQLGVINPDDEKAARVYWTPDKAGVYRIRAVVNAPGELYPRELDNAEEEYVTIETAE